MAAALTIAILPAFAHHAHAADAKSACLSSYVRAQELRNAGRLLDSRSELVACGQGACPEAVQRDCAAWLTQVEQSLPSLVVSVVDDAGVERTDARVIVDGKVAQLRIDGRAIAIDPGAHEVRVLLDDGRSAEARVLAKEGEKLRPIQLRVGAHEAHVEPAPKNSAPAARSVTPLVYVLGGVGLAAFATTGVFWGTGWFGSPGKQSLDECAPTCNPDDVDSVKRKLLVGNIAFAIGAAAAAAATVVLVADRVSVSTTANGVELRAWHRF